MKWGGFNLFYGRASSISPSLVQALPSVPDEEDVHFSCAADFGGGPVLALVAHSSFGRHTANALIVVIAARPLVRIQLLASKAVEARRVAAAWTRNPKFMLLAEVGW